MILASFRQFGLMHLLVVAGFAALTLLIIAVSRDLQGSARRRRQRTIAWVGLLIQAAHQTYWIGFQPDRGESLPLHLCDLAGMIAVAAFAFPRRWLRALLYYWGTGLSSLAFVIPVIDEGPATLKFWLFWLSHWYIVGGAVYLVAAEGFRPGTRDLLFSTVALLAVGLVTAGLNSIWGTHYMYTGDQPVPVPGLPEIGWPLPALVLLGAAGTLLLCLAHAPWIRWRSGNRGAEA
ncbi:MAG: TIGR02206 family membrane protein [Planctomycetota bacterium]